MSLPHKFLLLVTDLTQEILPPFDFVFVFNALGRESIDNIQDATPLIRSVTNGLSIESRTSRQNRN